MRRRQANQNKNKADAVRRTRPDGTVYYVDPKTGATIKAPGSGPASVAGVAEGAPRGQRAGIKSKAKAPSTSTAPTGTAPTRFGGTRPKPKAKPKDPSKKRATMFDAPAPPKKAPSKGVSKGSVKDLISTLTKTAYKQAMKAKKKAASDKKRGIKYIK